jgi:hypothetical protein
MTAPYSHETARAAWLAAALLAAAWIAAPAPAVADWSITAVTTAQRAPGTDIVLDLPDGWQASPLIPGFGNDALEATIVVNAEPGVTDDQLARRLSAEALAGAGFGAVLPGTLARPDPHLYFTARRLTGEEAYVSYVLGFAYAGGAALLTAHVPARFLAEGRVSAAAIEAILSSARHEPAQP